MDYKTLLEPTQGSGNYKRGQQVFDLPGSYTWIVPNINKIWVTLCGGGAGGNGAYMSSAYGSGGGSGYFVYKKEFNVTEQSIVWLKKGF